MKIIRSNKNKNILLNAETNFGTDLGWEEGFQEYEQETLNSLINPPQNFETVRYTHASYTGLSGMTQHDLWQEFYFYNSSGTHAGGLNYELIGLSSEDNYKIGRSDKTGFFRLEFYKVPSGETPTTINRKLVFTKNFPITTGEQVYYSPVKHNIYVPVFLGGNYRNKENMYLYWFQDNTALSGSIYDGSDFYLSAKFYNAVDGTSITFLNKELTPLDIIDEENDVYRKVVLNSSNYTYKIYTGITEDHRGGLSTRETPLRWYAGTTSVSSLNPYLQPTPSVTPSISVSRTPTPTRTPSSSVPSSPTPTPTRTPTPTPTPPTYTYFSVYNDSANTRDIDSITVNGVEVIGGIFPMPPGAYYTNVYTTQVGTLSVAVNFSAWPAGTESLRLQTGVYDDCQNGPGSTHTFLSVPVNGTLIYLDYDSVWC